jgi:hypothetical protein
MTTRVVINGKEVTNPVARTALVFGAVIVVALVAAVIVLLLLPLVGIAVTLTIGFVAVITVAIIASFIVFVVSASVFGRLFGPTEFRIEKTHKRE